MVIKLILILNITNTPISPGRRGWDPGKGGGGKSIPAPFQFCTLHSAKFWSALLSLTRSN